MSSPNRPRRDDNGDNTKRYPSCSRSFTRQGRQTYSTAASRQKAYRQRNITSEIQAAPPLPPAAAPRRDMSVYQCPNCEQVISVSSGAPTVIDSAPAATIRTAQNPSPSTSSSTDKHPQLPYPGHRTNGPPPSDRRQQQAGRKLGTVHPLPALHTIFCSSALGQVVVFCRAVRRAAPLGTPRPVQGSHPGAAL